jgi:hypothetical protein
MATGVTRDAAERESEVRRTGVQRDPVRPGPTAVGLTIVSVVVGLALATLLDRGTGFTPRVESIDALAGLVIAAFVVDRLLTFVPPIGAAKAPAQRAADLVSLRFGYGAIIGGLFVMLTDLRAVKALTDENTVTLNADLDRAITVLVVAGGSVGLAKLVNALNAKPKTDGGAKEETVVNGVLQVVPPPSPLARAVGVIAVVAAALIALIAFGNHDGIDLLGPGDGEGATDFVVRFGVVLLAAALVEQAAEFMARAFPMRKSDKPLYIGGLSVVLGVIAALVFKLYLLHNVGFFDTGADLKIALGKSTDAELWGDAFLTGLVIAAGTAQIHDLASRLRKAKETQQAASPDDPPRVMPR